VFYAPYYDLQPENSPSYTMVLPLPNSFLDFQFIRPEIGLNPTMSTHSIGYSMEIDKISIDDEVSAVQPSMMWHLSRSNIDYRLFSTLDPDDSLDGIIVRYQQNNIAAGLNDETQIFELSEGDDNDLAESYAFFDPIALKRLQDAVTAAVDPDDEGNLSLSYMEVNSWVRDDDYSWVTSVLNSSLLHTHGIVGGSFSLGWWNEANDNDDGCCGEFTKRTALSDTYDENWDSSTPDDDWDVHVFYPSGRKQDAVPGWFQSWNKDISIFSNDVIGFEWAVRACSSCGDDGDDTVLEVRAVEINSGDEQVQSWRLEIEDHPDEIESVVTKQVDSVWVPVIVPAAEFVLGAGFWDITITSYSISSPADRREAWFRLVNESVSGRPTYSPGAWTHQSGVLGEDGAAPEISISLEGSPLAPENFMWIENCLGYLYQSSPIWEQQCRSSR